MSNPKVKIPIMLSRWRVEYKGAYGRWEAQHHFPSRGAAVAYAQERRDEDPSTLTGWRVVDTQPDAEDEHAPIVVHSCADHVHASVPYNLRLYDYVPGEGLFIRERSSPEPVACREGGRVSRSTFISPRFPDQIRNLWEGDPSEQSVRTALALAGNLIQELIDLRESNGGDK